RVARQVFLLFILSAFLPFAVIAALSYVQIRQLHIQSGQQRLAVASKQYGMGVYERLLSAAEIARNAAEFPDRSSRFRKLAQSRFRALGFVDAKGGVRSLLGSIEAPGVLDAAASERLAQDKPLVLITPKEGAARIRLLLRSDASGDLLIGDVDPEYLWGDVDQLPAATEVCVIAETLRSVLHCSAPMPQHMLVSIRNSPSEYTFKSFGWTTEGIAQQSVVWAEFMGGEFGTGDWLIVMSQPESYRARVASELDDFFLPVALLALLIAVLLSLRQIRSILVPVEQLAGGARRVAQRDFSARVDVRTDDEFGELARAFNTMSEGLGRQFAVLGALAEIDRLILSTLDTEQVVRLIIERVGGVLSADCVSVTLLDPDNPDLARTYIGGAQAAAEIGMTRQQLSLAERRALQASPESGWTPLAAAEQAYLQPVRDLGMSMAYAQPVVWRNAVCGVLVLGYQTSPVVTEDDRKQISDFADRVAVAISSAWRDEQLYQQAHYDALTGLPNRLLLKDRVNREIARCQRAGGGFALLFIDLDHFKNINDTQGHSLGDRVLKETASRIAGCLRASDTVSRLGGDEFVVILSNPQHPKDVRAVGEHIVHKLSEVFQIDDHSCFLSASIGVAFFPQDGDSAETLIRNADTAMYRAKAGGRAQVVYFEEAMNTKTVERVSLDRELRRAIERGELELHYQPQINLATGEIQCAEALLRWRHPVFGIVPPVQFIPIAEEFGYIELIGEWIFRETCAQLKAWRAEGLPPTRVAVNVSPRQFRTDKLVSIVRECTSLAGVPPALLEVEITEGVLVDPRGNAEKVLRQLAEMGVEVSLDDFGTGFSSMAYLKRFPVHKIKIDRAFTEGLGRDKDSEAIVASIIAMSQALGKAVVAEGVETAEQLAILRKLRCNQAQGFYFSYPLRAAEFAEFVKGRRKAA
ncbi:MAG TPA: EAL domain-containing protein, partial [Burkholderiales bacterium]|nr:EAL domain-containing protein [Burkholderiales bacterium]